MQTSGAQLPQDVGVETVLIRALSDRMLAEGRFRVDSNSFADAFKDIIGSAAEQMFPASSGFGNSPGASLSGRDHAQSLPSPDEAEPSPGRERAHDEAEQAALVGEDHLAVAVG